MLSNVLFRLNICTLVVFVAFTGIFVSAPRLAAADSLGYRTLSWDDFKGPAPTGTENAEISSGSKTEWDTNLPTKNPDGTWTCKLKGVSVSAVMDRSASGVKDGKKTDALLQHEQYHFDISQYWARELEKTLNGIETTGATGAEARDAAKAAGEKAEADQAASEAAMQSAYDEETVHGTNAARQSAWCDRIGRLLSAPAPVKDGMYSIPGASSSGNYNAPQNLFSMTAVIDNFSRFAEPRTDKFMRGAQCQLPPLRFMGYYMSEEKPIFMPDPGQETFRVIVQGVPVLSGRIMLLLGSGNEATAWIEGVQINPAALSQSPILRAIKITLADGKSYLTLQLVTQNLLSQMTNGFTQSNNFPMGVHLGTSLGVNALTLSHSSIVGGKQTKGRVTLAMKAPPGGALVSLLNTNPAANMPSTVLVPAGQTFAVFPITTGPVAAINVGVIIASYQRNTKTADIIVKPH